MSYFSRKLVFVIQEMHHLIEKTFEQSKTCEILSCLRSFLDLEKIYFENRQSVGLEGLKTWAPENAKVLLSMFGPELFDIAKDYQNSIIGSAIMCLKM